MDRKQKTKRRNSVGSGFLDLTRAEKEDDDEVCGGMTMDQGLGLVRGTWACLLRERWSMCSTTASLDLEQSAHPMDQALKSIHVVQKVGA